LVRREGARGRREGEGGREGRRREKGGRREGRIGSGVIDGGVTMLYDRTCWHGLGRGREEGGGGKRRREEEGGEDW
jgi:hypothetical protein